MWHRIIINKSPSLSAMSSTAGHIPVLRRDNGANKKRPVSHVAIFVLTLCFPYTAIKGQLAAPGNEEPRVDRRVVVTVDDLPGAVPGSDNAMGNLPNLRQWNHGVVRALVKHHVPGIGFVIEKKLQVSGERDARAAILGEWIQAGLELGNHTYSHTHFNNTTLQQFEDETLRGEVVTKALLGERGQSERYFRHPALNMGSTPSDQESFAIFLKDHGYKMAPVTVEDADYEFNDVLDNALKKHDRKLAETIRDLYLKHVQLMFEFVEDASRKLFNREIPQILLIHDNEINAQLLDGLLTDLENRGYRFISMDEALTDPAYEPPKVFRGNLGYCYVCWGDRLLATGRQSKYPWASEPAWVRTEFEEIRRANPQ
jgi:peptidoglycan/xylan/chitin deacetylase (PgdA/CDA1 family)